MLTGDYEWTAEEWKDASSFRRGPIPEVKHQKGHRSAVHAMCGGVFRCLKCGKYFGWCFGSINGTEADDWCDDCWSKRRKEDG